MFRGLIAALSLSLLCGCLPSLNPLSSRNDITPEGLEGVWTDNDRNTYLITLEKGGIYAVRQSPPDSSLSDEPICWSMIVSKIGEELYVSVCLSSQTYKRWPKEAKDYSTCYSIPYFCIFKLELKGDELSLLPYDDSDKAVPLPPKLDGAGGRLEIFSASQQEMRDWVAKHSGEIFKKDGGPSFKRKIAKGGN